MKTTKLPRFLTSSASKRRKQERKTISATILPDVWIAFKDRCKRVGYDCSEMLEILVDHFNRSR